MIRVQIIFGMPVTQKELVAGVISERPDLSVFRADTEKHVMPYEYKAFAILPDVGDLVTFAEVDLAPHGGGPDIDYNGVYRVEGRLHVTMPQHKVVLWVSQVA